MYVALLDGASAELTITRSQLVRELVRAPAVDDYELGDITVELPNGASIVLPDVEDPGAMLETVADIIRATAAACARPAGPTAPELAALLDAALVFGAGYREACARLGAHHEAMLRMFEHSIAGSIRSTVVAELGSLLVSLMRAAVAVPR